MQIDWWTLGLQAVNVVVLLWLLQRFLFRPVTTMVAARRAAITRLVEDARADRARAAEEATAAEALRSEIAAGRDAALRAAAEQADAERAALLAAAHAESGRIRTAADAALARARRDDVAALDERASRLAVEIAAKLLDRLPPTARVSGFGEGLAAALGTLPVSTREEIGRAGEPIRIRAARTLDDEERLACRARLSDVLGRDVEIAVEVDPGLVAGLEIDTPHAIVRNSFRADLERISAALLAGPEPRP